MEDAQRGVKVPRLAQEMADTLAAGKRKAKLDWTPTTEDIFDFVIFLRDRAQELRRERGNHD